MTVTITPPREILELIQAGALFVVNHSGGKDSQAMHALLRRLVPADRLIVVHATLGRIEWPGTLEHIYQNAGEIPVHVAAPATGFFDMVRRRGHWPTPKYRQCTSDLKRTPIEREVRRLCKARGEQLIVTCMGMRAEESSSRARLATFKLSKRNSKAGRRWFEWLPIHHLSEAEVFQAIAEAGESPHWAYAAGMSRLSCSFCIMASLADLTCAARLRPDLYAEYVALESELGKTFRIPGTAGPETLEQITGVAAAA